MVRIRPWAPLDRRRRYPNPQEIRSRRQSLQFHLAWVKFQSLRHLELPWGHRAEKLRSRCLDTTFMRPIRCFPDRDCDQGSQPNPPVQETRPSDRSLRRAKVTFAWWARFPSEGRKVTTRKPGSVAEAAWSRGHRGASRGDPDAMKLQPASGSRSRRLPGGRQREAQASRRQSQGGGFREATGRKLPGSNGRPIGN